MKTYRRSLLSVVALSALLLAACQRSSAPTSLAAPPPTPATPEEPDTPLPPVTTAPEGQWLGGDLHVHDDHSSDGSLYRQLANDTAPGNVSVADQIGQGVLRGLSWMPLTDHRTYDQHYDPLWESADLILIPGEEANGSPHSTVQGAVDTVVQGASRDGDPGYMNLQQSIWDAHSQGASWSIAHPDDGETEEDGTPNARASAQGMDTIETWNRGSSAEKEIDYVENRWNAGFRFGVGGASDDHFRELWAVTPPGSPITSVFALDSSERSILQGLRAGRTSIRLNPTDPMVTMEADFQLDGVYEALGGDEVIAAPGTQGRLRVRVERGLGTTVLIYKSPGRSAGEFASFTPMGVDNSFEIDVTAEEQPTWYRAELRGPGQPATIDTNAIKGLPEAPGTLPAVIAQLSADTENALRGICSPIFISAAPVIPQPELPLPADSGSDDGAVRVFGLREQFSGFPDLAVTGDVTHAVAEIHSPGRTQIVYRQRNAQGAWSTTTVLTPASASARFPRIVARGTDVWVAWQDERAGQMPRRGAIYLRHSSDGGQSWQDEQLIRSLDGRAEHPALALSAAGEPVLAWQEISTGNPFDVMVQIIGRDAAPKNLSRDGKTISPGLLTDTRSALYPASVWPTLAVANDGRISIAWQDNRTDIDPLWTGSFPGGEGTDPDNWQIMVRTLPANGGDWSAPASLGADDLSDRHPGLAYAADGTLVAAWDSRELRAAGANLAVLAAVSHDSGASWSAAEPIAAEPNAMSQYVRLGRDGDAVRAVWYDSRSADWRWRVMTATFAGDAWKDAKLIPSPGVNTWPATDGGQIIFASTRKAARQQRDRTQQIFLLKAP